MEKKRVFFPLCKTGEKGEILSLANCTVTLPIVGVIGNTVGIRQQHALLDSSFPAHVQNVNSS
jgi:hypothetical protein